eukprot:3155148-Amphidinium_carterae.2
MRAPHDGRRPPHRDLEICSMICSCTQSAAHIRSVLTKIKQNAGKWEKVLRTRPLQGPVIRVTKIEVTDSSVHIFMSIRLNVSASPQCDNVKGELLRVSVGHHQLRLSRAPCHSDCANSCDFLCPATETALTHVNSRVLQCNYSWSCLNLAMQKLASRQPRCSATL